MSSYSLTQRCQTPRVLECASPRRCATHRPEWNSPRWAPVRLDVYRRAGFACVTCGWRPEVPAEYDGRRALGVFFGLRHKPSVLVLEIDHIIPIHHGGTNDPSNLQAMCSSCNARKGLRLSEVAT